MGNPGKWIKSWETQNTKFRTKLRKEDKWSEYAIEIVKLCPKCKNVCQYECKQCKTVTCDKLKCKYAFCWMCGIDPVLAQGWTKQNCDYLYKNLTKQLDKDYPT